MPTETQVYHIFYRIDADKRLILKVYPEPHFRQVEGLARSNAAVLGMEYWGEIVAINVRDALSVYLQGVDL